MAWNALHRAPGAPAPGAFTRLPVVIALLAVLLIMGAALADEPELRDPYQHFFTTTFGDLPEEIALARQEGKLGMFLFFEADACPYCEHMRRKVLSRPDVQDWYRERFVNIAVDIHGDVELTDFDGITLPSKVFTEHRKVYVTPVMMFIDLEGREIYRKTGMVRTPEEFLLLGEYIEGRFYYDRTFRQFAQQRGAVDEETLYTPSGESE
jgi:thioredoxin-related protein